MAVRDRDREPEGLAEQVQRSRRHDCDRPCPAPRRLEHGSETTKERVVTLRESIRLTVFTWVNRGLFERRLQDAKVPVPSNADGQLRSLWQEPLFVWVVTVGRERFRRGFINAGAAGHFLFGLNNDGDVQLAPQASSLVWHTLRDAVEDARFHELQY